MLNLDHAKRSYITRNVDLTDAVALAEQVPAAGDLVLARVDRLRQHTRLENPAGRRVHLFTGDEVILAAGARYATGQYHAETPVQLGKAHLVAAGGIAANVLSRNSQIKPATEITLLGTLVNQANKPLNLADYKSIRASYLHPTLDGLPVLMVMGNDMNSGKTSLAAAAINGLTRSGVKVAAAKLTGTGSGPDYWKMLDAGACRVRDFLDAGYASTAGLSTANLLDILRTLKADALQSGADLLVLEVADGVLQPENRELLQSSAFIREVTGALLAADSAAAAVLSCERVLAAGIPIYGFGGIITKSDLATEEAFTHLGLPVLTLDALRQDQTAAYLEACLKRDNRHETADAI